MTETKHAQLLLFFRSNRNRTKIKCDRDSNRKSSRANKFQNRIHPRVDRFQTILVFHERLSIIQIYKNYRSFQLKNNLKF